MANQLDELNPIIKDEGLDTNVIAKQIPVSVGAESTLFEIALWVFGIIPGIIFTFMKINAQKHFDQLQQKIQRNASQIDNYLEQRVVVLQNCARLLDKAIDLDKSTFENIAKYRSGNSSEKDMVRNEIGGQIETISRNRPVIENGNIVEPVVSEEVSVGSLEAAEERIETATNFDKIEIEETVEPAPEIQAEKDEIFETQEEQKKESEYETN